MKACIPVIPQELPATPLADVAGQIEPRLAELLSAEELEAHLRQFARQLRISAEREAIAKGDVAT